jgi:hypothetical protein
MVEILPTALNQLITFLEKNEKERGIKYYLVGGILANIYTVFRTTQDIDFVIDIQTQNISLEQYISLLQQNSFFPLQDWESAAIMARETNLLQFFDKQEVVKFDNYLIDKDVQSKYKKIGPLGLKRRVREKLFRIECWVASKEDFILSKLVYGGWQDYTDALGCWMRFSKTLDLPYLNRISIDLGVQKEFELLKSGIDDPDEYFKKINGY